MNSVAISLLLPAESTALTRLAVVFALLTFPVGAGNRTPEPDWTSAQFRAPIGKKKTLLIRAQLQTSDDPGNTREVRLPLAGTMDFLQDSTE